MNNFVGYNDKSSAKRGFGRKFKDSAFVVEDYLDQLDGKWGFSVDEEGQPVRSNIAPVSFNAPVETVSIQPVVVEVKDEEQDDEPEERKNAVGSFWMAQLGSAPVVAPVAPVAAPVAAPVVTNKSSKGRAEANGVKRPSDNTICASIWNMCAEFAAKDGIPALSKVIEAAEKKGINKFTARTQYARWRVFNGLTGRLPK